MDIAPREATSAADTPRAPKSAAGGGRAEIGIPAVTADCVTCEGVGRVVRGLIETRLVSGNENARGASSSSESLASLIEFKGARGEGEESSDLEELASPSECAASSLASELLLSESTVRLRFFLGDSSCSVSYRFSCASIQTGRGKFQTPAK